MSLLSTHALKSSYGDFQALVGVDFQIGAGEIVAIIGANNAGKSTFLRCLTGLNRVPPEAVTYQDEPIGGLPPFEVVKRGIALVPEGRRLFPSLTVEENLAIGADVRRRGPWTLERIYQMLPVLAQRRRAASTTLSGGQQQLVAIARALLSNPRLLLCDELSLGLAPAVIKDIYAILPEILSDGTALIIVEQDIGQAMRVADRVYCFQEGRVSLEGRSSELTREQISAAYFGGH